MLIENTVMNIMAKAMQNIHTTVFLCLFSNSAEECAKFYNETETHGVMMGENGEDVGRPCLIEGHLDIAKNWFGYLVTTTMKAKSGRFYYR